MRLIITRTIAKKTNKYMSFAAGEMGSYATRLKDEQERPVPLRCWHLLKKHGEQKRRDPENVTLEISEAI